MPPPLVFPPFRFEPLVGALWCGSERLTLRPKTGAVLHYLLAHWGRVVTREELREAVWPQSHGAERAPKQCIRELRALLGDTTVTPRFIETIGRQGYRFIGRIEPPGMANVPSAEGITATRSSAGLARADCVGREAELSELGNCLDRARRGERGVVFVTGEPGIGKTTLIETFCAGLATRNAWVGRGQCVQHHGGAEAYGPLLDALGRLLRDPAGARLVAVLERYAPAWLLALPNVIGATKRAALERRTQGTSPERMLRELIEALEALTAERPGILVLEDLQWSDAATLDWLAAWAARREEARLLVIGAYRPVDVIVQGHPLAAVTHELRLHGRCRTLALTGLSEEAVADYLRGRLAHCPPALGRLLHERTEGHPLFLVALLEEWQAEGLLQPQEGRWVVPETLAGLANTVPATVRQLIEHRFAQQSLPERRLLEAASVAGLEFSAAAVAAGLEVELDPVEEQCAGLARRHLFLDAHGQETWPDGTVAARYGFRHALYRQVVYGQLPAGRRVNLHRRTGARLEAAYGEETRAIAVALAEHFEEGRDPVRAVRYHCQAGETALARQAPRVALAHLNKGLVLMERWPSDSPERLQEELRLQTALGATLIVTEGFGTQAVEQAYQRADRLCQQLSDSQSLVPVLCGLWNYQVTRADFRRAQRLSERLLALAEPSSDPAVLPAHNAVGQTHLFMGEPAAALSHIDAVLARYEVQVYAHLAVQYGEDPGVVCRMYAALTRWLLGSPEQALQHIEAGMRLAQELAQPFGVAQMHWMGAVVAQCAGDVESVHEHAEALIPLCRDEGIAFWLPGGGILQGWVLAAEGETSAGIAAIRRGLEDWRAAGAKIIQPYHLALLAQAYAKDGQPDAGLGVLGEAQAEVRHTGERWYEAEIYRLEGELRLQQDGSEASGAAETCFRQALEIARRQSTKSLELRSATRLARLWFDQGQHQAAHDLLAPICAWFTEGFDSADLEEATGLLRALANRLERVLTPGVGNEALLAQ